MKFIFENHSPVYLQLSQILENAIISGEFSPGEKLPSVREIAGLSQTNPNTVVKALNEIEQKGLIETRRTSGKYVALPSKALEENRRLKAEALSVQFLAEMEKLGYSKTQSIELLQKGEIDDCRHSKS